MQQWLLLIPQLPAKPDYLRVKLRRRLAKFGAVAVKASVYALPFSEEAAEDFAWLRRDILSDGGDAIICSAALVDGLSDEGLAALFQRDANVRYAEIAGAARAALAEDAGQNVATYHTLRRRMESAVQVDYFDAEGRAAAEAALRQLDTLIRGGESMSPHSTRPALEAGQTWVTRQGVKVDRIGSAWLIRKFIDRDAHFRFVDPGMYEHESGELRFDMYDGEFTHEGSHCTFETLITEFGLEDAALRVLAEVVHDIDIKDARHGRAETAGLSALINGLVASQRNDEERLQRGFVLFDSLYDAFAAQQA